jgi:hypothetical protein
MSRSIRVLFALLAAAWGRAIAAAARRAKRTRIERDMEDLAIMTRGPLRAACQLASGMKSMLNQW